MSNCEFLLNLFNENSITRHNIAQSRVNETSIFRLKIYSANRESPFLFISSGLKIANESIILVTYFSSFLFLEMCTSGNCVIFLEFEMDQ